MKFRWFGNENCCEILPVKSSENSIETSIPLPPSSQSIPYVESLDARLNPATGKPVLDMMWAGDDVYVGMIDTDPGSPTFHMLIKNFNAGLSGFFFADAMTVSPDGNFAYLWYDDGLTWSLGIMNLTTGAFTSYSSDSLAVYWLQGQLSVAPDGKSLLLMSYKGNRARIKVFDISNPMHPKPWAELTPVPVAGRGFPYVANYQVIGDRLYAIDTSGIIVVFNFNRAAGDFRERGYYVLDRPVTTFAFSADGSNLYLADRVNDQILVYATDKLVTGKDAEVTSLRSPYGPTALGVSPVPPPTRLLKAAAPIDREPTTQPGKR